MDPFALLLDCCFTPSLIRDRGVVFAKDGLIHFQGQPVCELLQNHGMIGVISGVTYEYFEPVYETVQIAPFHFDSAT